MSGAGTVPPPSGDGASNARVPGWYPDRFRANEQRYWDGTAWSGRRRWVVDRWVPAEEPPEIQQSHRDAPRRARRGRWIAAAAVLVVLAGVAAVLAGGVFTARPSTTQSAGSPTTLSGVKTSPQVLVPGQPSTTVPAVCSVSTPSNAYALSAHGIYAVKSTLPSQAYTVGVDDGSGSPSNGAAGTTDASGNGLGTFRVPGDLGLVGYVHVTFASGTTCTTSFIVEGPG